MLHNRPNSSGGDLGDNSDSIELLENLQNGNEELSPKTFDPREQTWRLFEEQGLRLLITSALAALFIATLKIYERQGVVDKAARRVFNSIITCLSLILGLNFFDAFKDMAKVLRWRVLASRPFSVREADLILGGDSLRTLATLMRESRKKPLTLFVCMVWIALNILAQALIGMIGLTYSMDSGTNSTGIIKRHGTVIVPKLDDYYMNGNNTATDTDRGEVVAQNLAHAYGEAIQGQERCNYTDDSDIQGASQDCYYFSHTNGQEFAYRYAQYNPADSTRAYPYLTNRIVKASAGECFQYNVPGEAGVASSQDGINDTWVWNFSNSTFNGTISIPRRDAALDATTYIFNGTNPPPEAEFQKCGNRCIRLYAWRSTGDLTGHPQSLFQCPITVSEVSNVEAGKDWQALPDNNAYYAAASIALTGRLTGDWHWRQFRLYPWGSYWETHNLSASGVGARMAEFAIGSIATMANLNPSQQKQDILPVLGYELSIEWPYVISLVACIAGAHCVLVGLMLWIARSVVVLDDSNLCMARLLEGLVRTLEGRGSLSDGREIANSIQRQGAGRVRVVYGIGMEGRETERTLRLGDQREVAKGLATGRFPEGAYR